VINPTPIANPYLVQFNHELATHLWGENFSINEQEMLSLFSGNLVPKHLRSIALAYAGHQFGYYVPLLGDGRAVLLGEISSPQGKHWDVQLKGSGKTKFSRMGDGRAPLSAVLREYLISEAMRGLKIPTTHCLAAIASHEHIHRQTGPVPLGVLTRIASSSLRVGSFQFAAAQNDLRLLQSMANYALERHYPELLSSEFPHLALFNEVVDGQAKLIAHWMSVGFIHGVMNTDNMTISGETIDYGPCAFMDEFDYDTVFSSIDMNGRYSFGNQASIAKWNLAQLSHALGFLFTNEKSVQQLEEILNLFNERFSHYWDKIITQKLGLMTKNKKNAELIRNFFILLQHYKPDFTNTFRMLSQALDDQQAKTNLIKALGDTAQSAHWVSAWMEAIYQQKIDLTTIKTKMNHVNPAYIPRNHLVEQAIQSFIENHDRTLLDNLLRVLKNPFQQQEHTEHLQCLPLPHERVYQTFCGT
jgi:uncharacterized protein YdiU (UPF0061 family)